MGKRVFGTIHKSNINKGNKVIKVKFFAAIREQIGKDELNLPLPDMAAPRVGDLVSELKNHNDTLKIIFEQDSYMCAVNFKLVDSEAFVKDNDEVAFFPPVTGG